MKKISENLKSAFEALEFSNANDLHSLQARLSKLSLPPQKEAVVLARVQRLEHLGALADTALTASH
jgi:hypothetical protein